MTKNILRLIPNNSTASYNKSLAFIRNFFYIKASLNFAPSQARLAL